MGRDKNPRQRMLDYLQYKSKKARVRQAISAGGILRVPTGEARRDRCRTLSRDARGDLGALRWYRGQGQASRRDRQGRVKRGVRLRSTHFVVQGNHYLFVSF